jgi:crossover junction endodeoxyribonuclease RuvC
LKLTGPLPGQSTTESFELILRCLFTGIDRIIGKHGPDVVVIEEIFYRKNFKSAVMIGEARGVAMLAAARNSVDVVGYPPAQVKQAVVGNGRASKSQMQKMVQHLLDLKEFPAEDAADALAIALCYSHRSATRNKLSLPHAGVNC